MKKTILALLFLTTTSAHALLNPSRIVTADKTEGVSTFQNLVKNDGFENNVFNWTASGGTFVQETTFANIGANSRSGSWDSSSSGQTLTSASVAIPAGDYGANYEVSANLKCATGTCTHTIQAYDGTNIIASQTITSNTSFVRSTLNFVAPSSGNLSARIVSVAADEPIIYVDDVYLGRARNIGSVAQATLVGTIKITGCAANFSGTSASYANFATQTGCSYAVTGAVEAPTTNVPALRLRNQPPGKYHFIYSGQVKARAASDCSYRFSDGTNNSIEDNYLEGNSTEASFESVIDGSIDITSAISDSTFNIQQKRISAGTCDLYGTTAYPGVIKVYRFPSSSEIAYRPEVSNRFGAVKYPKTTNCRWNTTSASYANFAADADCTTPTGSNLIGSGSAPGTKIPAGVFTNVPPGTYLVDVIAPINTNNLTVCATQLHDGTNALFGSEGYQDYSAPNGGQNYWQNIKGVYTTNSFQSSLTINIQMRKVSGANDCSVDLNFGDLVMTLTPVTQSLPAPVLVGSVTAKYAGPGVAGWVSFGGASERSQCTSTPCTIYDQSGTTSNFISSVTRASTGNYTINFVSGVFTRAPYVVCYDAQGNSNTSFMMTNGSAPTTTAFGLAFSNYNIPGNRDTQADCLILGR